MKTPVNIGISRSNRPTWQTSALLLFALVTITFSVGCCCPEARTAVTPPDSPPHLAAARELLKTALAKQVWTAQDEKDFSRNLSQLSVESRDELATELARRINGKEIRLERRPPRRKGPPICPCTPGLCDATTATAGPPADVGPPAKQ